MAKLKKDLKDLQDIVDAKTRMLELDKQLINSMSTITNMERERSINVIEILKVEEKLNELSRLRNDYSDRGVKLSKKQREELDRIEKELITIKATSKDNLNLLDKQEQSIKRQSQAWEKVKNSIKSSDRYAKSYWQYLMNSDASIKNVVKSMGAFGSRSEIIRDNLYDAAEASARLGLSAENLAEMQGLYADALGKSVILTEKNYKNMAALAEGTILGHKNVALMSAEFAEIGGNVDNFREMMEGVVESTERMGLNTGKVLQNLNANFKAIQRYNFKQGVNGITDMAMYATKFRVDMGDALNSVEKARTLEGAIGLMSQLNVLGGKFAESDPFEMLFLARNDPEEYTKKLNKMTEGMANLTKTASGFEFQISALDRDRLRSFAEATGQDYGKVIEQALRRSQVDTISQQLAGFNLSNEDRELISNMASLDKTTGQFLIGSKSLANLTQKDIELFKTEQKTLEQRAIESQNFEKVLANTMLEFKAALLPILNGVNTVLKWFNASKDSWMGIGKIFYGAAVLLGTAVAGYKALGLVKAVAGGAGGGIKDAIGGMIGRGGSGGSVPTTSAPSSTGGGGGLAGGMSAKSIAAFGAAAAGAGAGIGLAAAGMSLLAKSFKELDPEQISGLNWTFGILGATMLGMVGILAAFAPAIGAAGVALLPFGASMLMIGGAVGIAAAGLGYFAEGIGTVLNASKDVDGGNLLKVAGGIAGIGLGLTTMGNPLALLGAATLSGVLGMLGKSDGISQTASNISSMVTNLKGSKSELEELTRMLDSISKMEIGDNSIVNKLNELLENPLKVEFKDKNIALSVNVTANLDGETIYKKMNVSEKVKIQFAQEREGRAASRTSKR